MHQEPISSTQICPVCEGLVSDFNQIHQLIAQAKQMKNIDAIEHLIGHYYHEAFNFAPVTITTIMNSQTVEAPSITDNENRNRIEISRSEGNIGVHQNITNMIFNFFPSPSQR